MAKVKTELDFSLVDNVTRGLKAIQDGVSGLGASIAKVNQAADLLGKAFDGAKLAGSVFIDGINSAREFEQAITAVGVVTGATGEELAQLKQAAEDASGAFSAKEAADGLAELARAGLSAKESIAALPSALALAQGQNISVAKSAELLTTTIVQFGLAASDAGKVADVLARSADASATSVEQTGLAFTYAAPLARQLGQTIEETAIQVSALANAGFRSEKGGTALRNVMSALLDPTSKFSVALRGAGITATDFGSVMEELGKRTDKGKSIILSLDSEARPAVLSFVAQSAEAMGRLTTAINDNSGAAKTAADAYEVTFNGALAKLTNAFDKARRALSEPLIAEVTDDFQEFADRVEAFAKSEKFREIAKQVGEFANQAAKDFLTFIEGVDFDRAAKSAGEFIDSMKILAGVAASVAGVFLKLSNVTTGFIDYQIRATSAILDFAAKLPGVRATVALYQGAVDLASGSTETLAVKSDQAAKATGLLGGIMASIRGKANSAVGTILDVAAAVEELNKRTIVVTPSLRDYENAIADAFRAGDLELVKLLTEQHNELAKKLKETAAGALSASQQLVEAGANLRKAIESGNDADISATLAKYKQIREEADKNDAKFRQLTETQTDGAQKAAAGVAQVGAAHQQTAETAANSANQQEQAMGGVSAAAQDLANRIIALRNEFAKFGAVASEEFEKRLDRINNSFRGTGTSMANYISALEGAAQSLRVLIGAQEELVQGLESGLSAAQTGVGRFGQTAEQAVRQLQQLEASPHDANGQFNLLSQQRLDRLRSEIRTTTQAIQAQAAALRELRQIAASGNDAESERLRYEEELANIQRLAAATGVEGERVANQARQAAEREHNQRMAQIAERAAAERDRYDQQDALAERNFQQDQQRTSGLGGPQPAQTAAQTQQPAPQNVGGGAKAGDINVTVNIENNLGESAEEIAAKLSGPLKRAFDRQAQLRG